MTCTGRPGRPRPPVSACTTPSCRPRLVHEATRGFTLVELLFHIFLLGILLSAVYGIFTVSLRFIAGQAQRHMDLQNAAQTAFMNIESELAQSDFKSLAPVPTPTPGGSPESDAHAGY